MILAPLFGKAQGGVVVDRNCTLVLAVSDTKKHLKNVLKFLIIDEIKVTVLTLNGVKRYKH